MPGFGDDPFGKGWEFHATLAARTPLSVLQADRSRWQGPGDPPAPEELWHGIWLPVVPTWQELGVDLPEMSFGGRASDIGPVPLDGGRYFAFLLLFREIYEETPEPQRRDAVCKAIRANPEWIVYVKRHGTIDDLLAHASGVRSTRRRQRR